MDRHVVHLDTPLGEELLDVAVRQREAQVAGHRSGLRLHLPVEKGARRHHRHGSGADPQIQLPATVQPAGPTQPGPAGWCAYFRHGVSAATFQYLDAYTWRRVVSCCASDTRACRGRRCGAATCQAGGPLHTTGARCSTPAWSRSPATATGERASRHHGQPPGNRWLARGVNPWRAGCGESRTSGSAGGPGKRTGRKTSTAPRPDPTPWRCWRTRSWPSPRPGQQPRAGKGAAAACAVGLACYR